MAWPGANREAADYTRYQNRLEVVWHKRYKAPRLGPAVPGLYPVGHCPQEPFAAAAAQAKKVNAREP